MPPCPRTVAGSTSRPVTATRSTLWQRLAKANKTFRNYGFYVSKDAQGNSVAGDPLLNANTDPAFDGYNLSCPDSPGSFTPAGDDLPRPSCPGVAAGVQAVRAEGRAPRRPVRAAAQ